MENFTKNSLKAAVAKYGPLHTDGKAEADVRAALVADERGFTPEQVDEIYAAIVTPDIDQPQATEAPEWLQTILDSNQAVLESNQSVLNALQSLKDFAQDRSSNPDAPIAKSTVEFDENAKYEVAEGKSFRDSNNFSLEYKEGDDVTHLGADRLKVLLNSGLIQETE